LESFSRYTRTFLAGMAVVLLLLGCFNWVIDPFNRNKKVDLGLPKEAVSSLMNYQMYKILQYDSPSKIILGDSRSDALRAEYFADENVYNFSYGGGTLYEAIDTFWFANQGNLKAVVLGVPFCIYTEANSVNRFPAAKQVTRNPLSYYLSPLVTKSGVMALLTKFTGHSFKTERPKMSKEQFWSHQLGPGTSMYYDMWSEPKVLKSRLIEMVEYCDSHDIELLFFIPPTHQDLQDKLIEYQLVDQYNSYKQTINNLGTVLDYDVPGEFTSDRDNFLDPYHFTKEVARDIAIDIIGLLSKSRN